MIYDITKVLVDMQAFDISQIHERMKCVIFPDGDVPVHDINLLYEFCDLPTSELHAIKDEIEKIADDGESAMNKLVAYQTNYVLMCEKNGWLEGP